MSYAAEILEDSISPDGVRLTTVLATFPRPYLAEINTHRVFSRNSASSRAIPPEKNIERVIEDPYIPETFNQRVKGMGVGEAFNITDQSRCREWWLTARDFAVQAAQVLNEIGVDKSRVNRLLEPFMWHTAIISSTEWDNFFALRQPMEGDVPSQDHGAQPEVQIIARMIYDAMEESDPGVLDYGQWHLPLVSYTELDPNALADKPPPIDWDFWKKVSARRVARVSFDKHTDTEDPLISVQKAEDLVAMGHLSPLEHVARPIDPSDFYGPGAISRKIFVPFLGSDSPKEYWSGNFRGWFQFRKEIEHEDNFMERLV